MRNNSSEFAPATAFRKLDRGYVAETDAINEHGWNEIIQEFTDASIYQTWPYLAVIAGRHNMSHLILRKDGAIVAAAQVRIAKVPMVPLGVAYVRWGPLWRRASSPADASNFRQAIRALRNEFVYKRGLLLRLLPMLFDGSSDAFQAILAEEGFSVVEKERPSRTILMDLGPALETLREGMRPHWKRELKLAERHKLEVLEGSSDDMFQAFISIYKDMVSRKKFVEPNDINQFRRIQAGLPDELKMKIMLCRSADGICAGLICSVVGGSAIYLFGATSTVGMKSNGSYLLQWKLLEALKKNGCTVYNLNGINPSANPGTYKFKHDLAGQHGADVYFMGRFDSFTTGVSYSCFKLAERLRQIYRTAKRFPQNAKGTKLKPKEAA